MTQLPVKNKIMEKKQGDKLETCKKLLNRIIPNRKENFEISLTELSNDSFRISSKNGKILLEGNSPVSVASALNWYLKYYSKEHLSWCGNQLSQITQEIEIEKVIEKTAQFNYRYYLNFCTYSYTMPWWNWERWEKEIDWMALNGINLSLALIGQEKVWQNFITKLGFDENRIFEFLPGPAYLAWGWLGNFDGWGGPTTQNWIDDQKELQVKIIKRMNDFGIKPILQVFTGRVPKFFKEKYPKAKIDKLPSWYGYDGVYFLDPSEPLFKELSKLFIKVQTELYGNSHFFAGDIFHEIDSLVDDNAYLDKVYKGIQDGLLHADKDAKWVLQSWSIRNNNIHKLDKNHIIILDLYCDSEPKWQNTGAFHGHPWIWNIINNFGGRVGLGGNLKFIADEISRVKQNIESGKLVGIGSAPEGIENNPVVYDLLFETNWQDEITDIENWVFNYAERRYGYSSDNIKKAWKILLNTVYTGTRPYPPIETILCAVPSLDIEKAGSNGSTRIYYDNAELRKVIELFLTEKNTLGKTDTYLYDILDVTRQYLSNCANFLYVEFVKSIKTKNIKKFDLLSEHLINLMKDLDELLSSNKRFSLGKWLQEAKNKAVDNKDLKVLEWNARRQITLWSSPEIDEFHDYANKQWGGLILDYYLPRWELFIEMQRQELLDQTKFDSLNFKNKIFKHAVNWSDSTKEYKIENGLNSIELIEKILNKNYLKNCK